ncbi:MAG TPA: pirin family protein [Casimicrobiaceae bacterium]|nr:pirin family protein [Casimicrobiaceae bacterium]
MTERTVKALHPAMRDDIGDLVTRRPLPGTGLEQLDPFLFLNHHGPQTYPPHNHGLPFGPHPHRGFETVTLIVQGELAHRDSAGHESVIRAGGVQWMTAGRGIVHSEVSPSAFEERGGPLEILQLWVNLPARLKMSAPRYVGLQRTEIPAVPIADGRGTLHLIAGEWRGERGPIATLTDVFMSTVALARSASITVDRLGGRNVLLYVVRGRITIGDGDASAFTLVELERAGDACSIMAHDDSLLLLGHADPIGEPVVAYGPFVMNTREEIGEAILDYRAGKFDALSGDLS